MSNPIPPPPVVAEQKVFTVEQMVQLLEICALMQDRAEERGAEQSVVIIFNGKKWPVHFNGTDNWKPVRPTNYQAE